MRLTLIFPVIGPGGADRVMSILASHWAARGWDVTLLTLDDGREPPFFPLHSSVQHHALGVASGSRQPLAALANNLRRLRTLRSAIVSSRPDLVLSFMDSTNVLALIASRGLGVPVVVSQRNNPARNPIGPAWSALRRHTFPLADALVVQTAEIRDQFPLPLRDRIEVIPNPVMPPASLERPGAAGEMTIQRPAIVAVGRLTDQKGFDLLLQAFARIAEQHPAWHLTLLGEGPLRNRLEHLRDLLGLAGRAQLPGVTPDIYPVLRQADLFVLPSRFEGFPNALCEAMACGLPVIATDCPTGPRDIIRDGLDGLLVAADDIDALAGAMERLMDDPALRTQLAGRAGEIVERFGIDQIAAKWEAVFTRVQDSRR